MSFQNDIMATASDWFEFASLRFDWLRALSNEHQFENRPEMNSLEIEIFIKIVFVNFFISFDRFQL